MFARRHQAEGGIDAVRGEGPVGQGRERALLDQFGDFLDMSFADIVAEACGDLPGEDAEMPDES